MAFLMKDLVYSNSASEMSQNSAITLSQRNLRSFRGYAAGQLARSAPAKGIQYVSQALYHRINVGVH